MIDNLSSGDKTRVADDVTLHTVDIRDAEAVNPIITTERSEVIYHLAAQISVRASVSDPEFDATTNILGTLNLLTAAHAVDARIILASTGGAMYGDGVPMPTPETVLPMTHAPYGISKYGAEQYLALFNRLHGSRHVALRLGNVFGPRQDPHGEAGVVAIFCGQVRRDETSTVFGDGKQTRDYVYVYVYVYVSDTVTAHSLAGGAAAQVRSGTESITLDAAWGAAPSGLPGPAHLLAAALAACLLKNLARAEDLLSFRYERAEVRVTARR